MTLEVKTIYSIRHDQVVRDIANSLELYYDTRCGYTTVSEKRNVISNTKYFSARGLYATHILMHEVLRKIAASSQTSCLFFLLFPCVGVRLIFWSLRSTATFVICFHRSLAVLGIFSPFCLPPLPFSNLSSHSPPVLAVVFLVFWNLLAFCLGSFR